MWTEGFSKPHFHRLSLEKIQKDLQLHIYFRFNQSEGPMWNCGPINDNASLHGGFLFSPSGFWNETELQGEVDHFQSFIRSQCITVVGAGGGGASLVTFLNVSLELSRKSGESPSLHQLTITIIMWLTTRKRSISWLHNQSQQEAYLIYKTFQNKRSH